MVAKNASFSRESPLKLFLCATLKMSRLVLLAGVVLLVCVITTCSAVPHTRESRNSNQAATLQDAELTAEALAELLRELLLLLQYRNAARYYPSNAGHGK